MSRPNAHRIRDAVLSAGLAILVVGGPAAVGIDGGAQATTPYPPSAPVCTVTPDQPPAYTNVSVSCTGFDPHTPVVVGGGGSGLTLTASAVIDSNGGATVTEKTGKPGNANWNMVGRLPGGAAGKGVARAAVNGRQSLKRANVLSQVGTLSHNPVRVGEQFTFSGCGYKPGTTVTITDTAGDSFGTARVGPDGCFHKKLVMSDVGNFTLVATGESAGGGTLITTVNLTVAALNLAYAGGRGSDAGPGLGLAFTGADGIGVMVVLGLGLTAAGTGFVARGRRRQLVRTI